mmetsp:Transcript_11114/g.19381  ORF Transcript_11114/g.19381 Transcript_11114/m.19381 type:complete len:510 (-) Transcript_11114:222-1751(-)|eukprot:CAMPEP_0119109024 /NCGR_PEP_ID=MMETSP1180-20130426/16814_1 /TAXON_ID=3052 ORGANISM="Chlamydomonas cf sp, Strain CCMP681" /NCGR_SAMPLE_ID=MMETSP1180 /ASSEMBLY_ACC=CAM_ASM_000741 /LENGTH=509 /DNA_ID=CAMNT_0007094719 /DNA_START=49 /DNA_END=1578 /DNA_ORIENTATION=-
MQQTEEEQRELAGSNGRAVLIVSSFEGTPPNLSVPPAPPLFKEASGHDSSGASALASVFTLCNSAIGAGVLSLPFAFQHAGLIGGALMVLIIGMAEGWTLYVLAKFAEAYNIGSFGMLVRRMLGRRLALSVAIIMVLYLWSACVVYLIILGDTLSAFATNVLPEGSPHLNRRHVIIGASMLLLPLCMLRRLGHLSHLSALAVSGFVYTAGVVIGVGAVEARKRSHPLEGVALFHWSGSALFALPIVVFGFNSHANVVSIFTELAEELDPRLPVVPIKEASMFPFVPHAKTEKMQSMLAVIACSMLIIGGGYVGVGSMGYIGFPTTVGGNVLNALPQDNVWVQGAMGVVSVIVFLHFPLNHHPARGGMQDIILLMGGTTRLSRLGSFLFTLGFVSTAAALACVVTSLGDALHVIGGTAAAALIFFVPGAMLMNAGVMKAAQAALEADTPIEPGTTPRRGLDGLSEPLLQEAAEKGMKKTGIVHAPGKSWAAGLGLVIFSIFILLVTLGTL